MSVTDKMVDAACQAWIMQSTDTTIGHAMKAAIEAAMQASWISVGEKLPAINEHTGRSITVNTNKGVLTYIRNVVNPPCWENQCGYVVPPPTKWMPIPEYKGE